jgi:threonine/homoserine/homoserine lactone efflux protein
MDALAAIFVSAFGIGIAFCAPPGAVTAEALRRGIARGFWPVLMLEFGSIIGDLFWAAIALAGAAVLVQNPVARAVLGALGAVLLLWLAWHALRDAREGGMPKPRAGVPKGDFAAGAALSMTNPVAVGFWLGIGGAVVGLGVPDPGPIHFAVFFAGYLVSLFVWCFFISGLIAYGRRWVSPTLFRGVNVLCALALAYFALNAARGLLA